MKVKIIRLLVSIVVIAIVTTVVIEAPRVSADQPLQTMSNLGGIAIYFSEDNGEASRFDRSENGLSRLAGLLQRSGASLKTLEWGTNLPADADLIVVAGPTTDLNADQTARLWSYLSEGGRLLLAADPLLGRRGAFASNSPIFTLMWNDMGIRPRDDVVVIEAVRQGSVNENSDSASQISGDGEASSEVPALLDSFTTNIVDSEHPITQDITGPIAFNRSRTLEVDASIQSFVATSLVMTVSDFYGETRFGEFLESGVVAFNIGEDTTRGRQTLMASVESSRTDGRIVLIGDKDFATNGGGLITSPPRSASFVYPENVRILMNSIAWLVNAETPAAASLSFPTPGPTATATITPSPTPTPLPTEEPMTDSQEQEQ